MGVCVRSQELTLLSIQVVSAPRAWLSSPFLPGSTLVLGLLSAPQPRVWPICFPPS